MFAAALCAHIYRGADKSLAIAAAETWLDGQLFWMFFLSGLQKFEQRAKKCIELRGEYVEYIPSLVACFLLSRAKDLPASLYNYMFCDSPTQFNHKA